MQIGSKEHYDLMAAFERLHKRIRLDKEPKEDWKRGVIYQDGNANALFMAFRQGYSLGKVSAREAGQ